jgi:hypothetical protein
MKGRIMSKQRNIARDAKRTKPQDPCGHASRYRNKRGCVKCRRENGATLGKPFKRRKERTPQVTSSQWDDLAKAAAELGLS